MKSTVAYGWSKEYQEALNLTKSDRSQGWGFTDKWKTGQGRSIKLTQPRKEDDEKISRLRELAAKVKEGVSYRGGSYIRFYFKGGGQ